MALSSDSTCVNHLYSAQDGYETLHLEKIASAANGTAANGNATADVAEDTERCIFPDWMQGKWESLDVKGGNVVYRDEANFVTYRGRCARTADADRFVVRLDTDCGEPTYGCALFQQRDANVMEFQLGRKTSLTYSSMYEMVPIPDSNPLEVATGRRRAAKKSKSLEQIERGLKKARSAATAHYLAICSLLTRSWLFSMRFLPKGVLRSPVLHTRCARGQRHALKVSRGLAHPRRLHWRRERKGRLKCFTPGECFFLC